MKNVLLICRKELKSYFASPIAYAVMAIFGLIFGWVFFNASRDFVRFTLLQAQEGGGPVSVNDSIIRPLLGFAGTIGLFLHSHDHHARFRGREDAPAPSNCCSPRR